MLRPVQLFAIHELSPARLLCPWNSPGQNTGVGSLSLLQGILKTQIESRSPTLQVDSLPAESQGKPKNTGVGSLSLLQRILSTQELNQGLLHCRQVLYQLSYQGIPKLPQFSPQPGPEHHPLYLGSYSSLLTGSPVSLLL